MTVTAVYAPHNDGIEVCYLTAAGQQTPPDFIDLYECDLCVAVFDTQAEAEAWIAQQLQVGTIHDPINTKDQP